MNRDLLTTLIIDQQKQAGHSLGSKSFVQRKQITELKKHLKSDLVKVIIGVRRCGKSTLSLSITEDKPFIYINFDDERLMGLKAADLGLLMAIAQDLIPKAEFIILDEIQNVEGWELFVNRIKRQGENLIITGSNSNLLSRELASHLTGRYLSIELFPFSFSEFLAFKKQSFNLNKMTSAVKAKLFSYYQSYKESGGFPEAISSDSKNLFLQNLYASIISRDIASRRNIKQIKVLKELALLLFSQYACRFTYQSLKKTLGMKSISTVKNYVSYLQEAYLGFVLEPYSHKVKERISLPKKFYVIDLAMAEQVTGQLQQNEGQKIENLVYLELLRRGKEVYNFLEPSFEVDFCLREGRRITSLIQVSLTLQDEKTKKREIKALIQASHKLKCNDLWIVTQDEKTEIKHENLVIKVVPIDEWLLDT